MKAAVFGSDKLYEEAQETAKEWASETEPPAPPPVDPKVKREALTRAVRLYAELNAHPRALALIEENKNAFEDPDSLRKEIEEQWLAVVKGASRMATKVVLYGHEVYPNGDPLKVRIPLGPVGRGSLQRPPAPPGPPRGRHEGHRNRPAPA